MNSKLQSTTPPAGAPSVSLQQSARLYSADTQTPVSLYLKMVGAQPGILLESAEVDGRLGRYSLIAWDFCLHISCRQGRLVCEAENTALKPLEQYSGGLFVDTLPRLMTDLQVAPDAEQAHLPAITRSLVGYFTYGFAALLEPRLRQCEGLGAADATLVLPSQQILFDHLRHRCVYIRLNTAASNLEPAAAAAEIPAPRIGPVRRFPEKELYCRNVARIRELIHAGEAIQVVLSTRFEASFSGNPFALYRRLRQTNPSPYMFFLHLEERTLLGASPELLVRCSGNQLSLRPIAGTRPRGLSPAQDQQLARDLIADAKERAEHVMLVDLGRNDLGRIAEAGSVTVEKFMEIERFSHVMHLTSYLGARLRPGLHAMDILRAAFPAGTVSGAPKIRAMEIIADLETQDRGPYAGAVGWLGLDTDQLHLDTGITIRSLWIEKGRLHWQAGAGIVSDSEPEKEWQECLHKAGVIHQILHQGEQANVFTD